MRLQTKKQRVEYQESQIKSIQERNPLGFTIERIADLVVVSYVSQFKEMKRPCLKIWKVNGAHPFINYSFRSLEHRQDYAAEQIKAAQNRSQYKADKQKKRREFRHDLKVDDLLCGSWGYDQTNIDYFRVVRAEEFFVTVRKIGSKNVPGSDGFMSCQVQPDKDCFTGPPKRKKVCEGNSIKIHSFCWASLCTKESKHYKSWYA